MVVQYLQASGTLIKWRTLALRQVAAEIIRLHAGRRGVQRGYHHIVTVTCRAALTPSGHAVHRPAANPLVRCAVITAAARVGQT